MAVRWVCVPLDLITPIRFVVVNFIFVEKCPYSTFRMHVLDWPLATLFSVHWLPWHENEIEFCETSR